MRSTAGRQDKKVIRFKMKTYFDRENRGIPACRSEVVKLMERDAKMGLGKDTISKESVEEGGACELHVSAPKAACVENLHTILFRACIRIL
jgi:hypothetical protein